MWRFTIERIRTMVVVAAVLLVVAIGVFLGIAKFRRPFSRRDIPQRLGINIQQEANGVTYTQAHGGHTIFKIHASKVVQLRNNHATLHDVVIELYGKDGARVDRIQGSEFEYDQTTSIATAAGAVEIEMQRPTAAPPPGNTSSQTGPGTPAKPNPNDSIFVKTRGITFNQQTGVVTTTERVQFTTGQGSGNAMGARYDADLGYLVLDHDVVLTTVRGANPVTLRAAHAEFNRDNQVGTLRQATAQTSSEQATAAVAVLSFRDDGSVDHLNASQGLTISAQAGSHLAAPTGAIEFTTANRPRHAHLEGGVILDSASAGRTAHGTAPTMDLEFTAAGDLRHAHLERGVAIESHEVQVQDTQAQAAPPIEIARTWRSPIADIDFRTTAPGRVEPALLHGTGGAIITSETRRPGAAPVPSRLAADDLTAQFGPHSSLSTMTGLGHASVDETAATGAHQTATGDRLEAHFNPNSTAQPASTKSIPSASTPQISQLQTAQLDGQVVLIDQPQAKQGEALQSPLRATAGRAVYESAGPSPSSQGASEPLLHLTLNPRVTDGGIQLAADKIDVAQTSGDAFAHGNVKATWLAQKPSSENSTAEKSTSRNPSATGGSSASGGSAQQSIALGGSAPAHVIAAEAQLHQSTGEATFRGRARLWQDQNSISAPVIVLNRQQQTLVAQAASAADPVLSVFLSAGAAPTAPQPASAARTPSLIRVRSGDFHYSAIDRKAVLHAAPLSNVIAQTGTVETASDQLELYLTPAGNPQTPGAPARVGDHGAQPALSNAAGAAQSSQIDRVVAIGHVTLNSQGRHGNGTQLVYTALTGNYVLTGTASAPPRMTDPQRGAVTGESLIFNSRDDSVSIEGGAQATTTQTTAPR